MDTKQKFRRKSVGFESLERRQKNKKTIRIIFYAVLTLFFTVAFFLMWFFVFFKVRDVEIIGNTRYSASEIRAATGISEGDNLYSASENEISRRLSERLPYIRSVTLEKKIPSTVVITVNEDRAVMYSELYGDTYLISEDMTVLERCDGCDTEGLIEVSAGEIRRCFAGENISYTDSRMASVIVQLYNALKTYNLIDKVDSFSIGNRFSINVRYDNRLDIYFGGIDNIDIKVRFFVGILEHLYDDEAGRLDISDIKEASYSRYAG